MIAPKLSLGYEVFPGFAVQPSQKSVSPNQVNFTVLHTQIYIKAENMPGKIGLGFLFQPRGDGTGLDHQRCKQQRTRDTTTGSRDAGWTPALQRCKQQRTRVTTTGLERPAFLPSTGTPREGFMTARLPEVAGWLPVALGYRGVLNTSPRYDRFHPTRRLCRP